MERVIKYVMWLLIAFMLGITIGVYFGGVTAKQHIAEQMAIKDNFVTQQFSE